MRLAHHLRWLALSIGLACAPPVLAEAAIDIVQAALGELTEMHSSFEQVVQGSQGELIEYSAGTFTLARPRFRWEVQDPFPQIIVSDGALLQIYDPDLEQVTRRSVEEALAGTPLGLLAGGEANLAETFIAEELGDDADPIRHFVLTSINADAPYQRIDLWMEAQVLLRIEVLDHFQQRLRVEFIRDALPPPDPDAFDLELPEGTEIVQG